MISKSLEEVRSALSEAFGNSKITATGYRSEKGGNVLFIEVNGFFSSLRRKIALTINSKDSFEVSYTHPKTPSVIDRVIRGGTTVDELMSLLESEDYTTRGAKNYAANLLSF